VYVVNPPIFVTIYVMVQQPMFTTTLVITFLHRWHHNGKHIQFHGESGVVCYEMRKLR